METLDEWQSTASGSDIAVRCDTDDKEVRLIAGTGQVWLQRPDVVRLIAALKAALAKLPTH